MPLPTITNTPNPRRQGFQARLGTAVLRLAASSNEPYRISRGPAQTDTVSTEQNPEDFTDNFGRAYSQVEFTGGEGRRYAHRRSNEDQFQTAFWKSYGLELTEDRGLRLVNRMGTIVTAPGTAPDPVTRAAYDGTDLWVTDGTTSLNRITNLSAASPSQATVATGAVNDIEDLTVVGSVLHAATSTQILFNSTGPTTFTQYSDLDALRLWSVKNRVIASDGPSLYEDPAGAGPHTALITLPAGEEWVEVVDGGAFVWAVATDGTLYSFTFDGSALSQASQLNFHEEDIRAVGALYGSVFLVSTAEEDGDLVVRFWQGFESTSTTLADLRVVQEWTTSALTNFPRFIAETERDTVHFAFVHPDTSHMTMWSYNLEFGSMFSGNYVRDLDTTYATNVIKMEGKHWLICADGSVYRETSTAVSSGTFVGPAVDFFNADDKVWGSFTLASTLDSTSTLKVYVSNDIDSQEVPFDESAWTLLKTYTSATDEKFTIPVPKSRYLTVRLVLSGPAILQGYTIRALPPVSDEQVLLNINVSDVFSRPGKRPVLVKNYGEQVWNQVRDLQGQSIDLELYDLGKRWRGSIVEVSSPVERVGPQGSVTRIMNVLYRGREVSNTVTDTAVWGRHQWGATLWGGIATSTLEAQE